MSDSFRVNARTLCGMAATLACLLLLDIQSLRQTSHAPISSSALSGAVQERVVTHEFNLVDDSGQTRVRLGMNDLNAPALSLSDQNGQERALLRLNQNDVPSLRLFDSSGTLRQGLGFTSGTLTPRLWFFDENGSTQQLIPGSNAGMNLFPNSADYTKDWIRDCVPVEGEVGKPEGCLRSQRRVQMTSALQRQFQGCSRGLPPLSMAAKR